MRIDLHAHSRRSDGSDTPTELVEAAKTAGLDVIAITDHDNTDGWAEAGCAASRVGIDLVRGVEMTTDHHGSTVHLLGYEFDPANETLVNEFDRACEMREERVDKILGLLNGLDLLKRSGKRITREDVEAAAEGAPIGKPHFQGALVAKELVPKGDTYRELFKGGKAYVKRTYTVDLTEAVTMIAKAGGQAVVAHPWARGGRTVLTRDAFKQLKKDGLMGIEAIHPDHSDDERTELTKIARDLGLVITGGSDYHGTVKTDPRFSLGSCTTDVDQFNELFPKRPDSTGLRPQKSVGPSV